MCVKPILFNTDMVKAILDGRKTVTRRAVKKCNICPGQEIIKNLKGQFELYNVTPRCGIPQGTIFKPPYQPGDILYVRETWVSAYDGEKYFYLADKRTSREQKKLLDYGDVKWRPSICRKKRHGYG